MHFKSTYVSNLHVYLHRNTHTHKKEDGYFQSLMQKMIDD